ncbi:artemin [Rhinatrema bivittatum]|uniref:artemin n=1 Tax=Rhinatrema bivittatum TaxID=194408 RepID=UPI00112D3392|nr:artemin [Rhinatrema bivittatum]XP_029474735.1 artemin [Rhinatrema bivittatum]
MGRGLVFGKNHHQSCKVTLWTAFTLLSLLAGMITGSPPPEDWQMGTAGGISTTNPELVSEGLEDNVEFLLRSTWSSLLGDNATLDGQNAEEFADDLLFRSERSPANQSKPKKNRKPSVRGSKGCRIRSLMVKVQDLGLGYNSDEIVRFKYCSGSCQRSRNNYDLTLSSLLKTKAISPGPHERINSHPCCRPTKYEPVSFMDVKNTWQTVDKLSAAECNCIG